MTANISWADVEDGVYDASYLKTQNDQYLFSRKTDPDLDYSRDGLNLTIKNAMHFNCRTRESPQISSIQQKKPGTINFSSVVLPLPVQTKSLKSIEDENKKPVNRGWETSAKPCNRGWETEKVTSSQVIMPSIREMLEKDAQPDMALIVDDKPNQIPDHPTHSRSGYQLKRSHQPDKSNVNKPIVKREKLETIGDDIKHNYSSIQPGVSFASILQGKSAIEEITKQAEVIPVTREQEVDISSVEVENKPVFKDVISSITFANILNTELNEKQPEDPEKQPEEPESTACTDNIKLDIQDQIKDYQENIEIVQDPKPPSSYANAVRGCELQNENSPIVDKSVKAPPEKKSWEHQLKQREKQILLGKNTPEYQNYIEIVSKESRDIGQPVTPDKNQQCSKRRWDGQVKKWRRLLHEFTSS